MITGETNPVQRPPQKHHLPVKMNFDSGRKKQPTAQDLRMTIAKISASLPHHQITEFDTRSNERNPESVLNDLVRNFRDKPLSPQQIWFESSNSEDSASTLIKPTGEKIAAALDFHGRIRFVPQIPGMMEYNPTTNEILVGEKAVHLTTSEVKKALVHERTHQTFDALSEYDQQQIIDWLIADKMRELELFYELLRIDYDYKYFAPNNAHERAKEIGRGLKVSREIEFKCTNGEVEKINAGKLVSELIAFAGIETDYDPKTAQSAHKPIDQLAYAADAILGKGEKGKASIPYLVLRSYGLFIVDEEKLYEEYQQVMKEIATADENGS